MINKLWHYLRYQNCILYMSRLLIHRDHLTLRSVYDCQLIANEAMMVACANQATAFERNRITNSLFSPSVY